MLAGLYPEKVAVIRFRNCLRGYGQALEKCLRGVVRQFYGIPRLTPGKKLSLIVFVQPAIGGPHVNADQGGLVFLRGRFGRPVEHGRAEADSRIASADDHSPDVNRWLGTLVRGPYRPLVRVHRLLCVDGDRAGHCRAVPEKPGLALVQVGADAVPMSSPVRPGLRPLIRVFARPQPIGRFAYERVHFLRVLQRALA